MPWQETGVRNERTRFVVDWERKLESMAELCRRYGGEPPDRLQMAAALPAAGLGRIGRPLSRATTPSPSDCDSDRARDSRSAGTAHPLGRDHLASAAAAGAAQGGLAGGEHHRESAAATRSDGAAAAPAPGRADPAAADSGERAQPGLVRRLQRLVPHPRRGALRSVNDLGCGQPLLTALPGCGETGWRTCPAVVRGDVSGVWPAAGATDRQRAAICDAGSARAGGMVDQVGDLSGADRAGTSRAERAT